MVNTLLFLITLISLKLPDVSGPPTEYNALKTVAKLLMLYPPGCATSPVTKILIGLSLLSDTSKNIVGGSLVSPS